jgi:hypothetical protein
MTVKRVVQALLFLAGAGLLVALVARTDTEKLWERVSAAGVFFAWACAAYAATTMATAAAWHALVKRNARPGYPILLAAHFFGESVNFVLPAGAPGEVAKGAVLRDRVAPGELAISLTMYNWLEGLAIFAVVMLSAAYALVAMDVPRSVPVATLATAATLMLVTAGLRFALRRSAMRPVLRALSKLPFLRFDPERASDRVAELDRRIRALWQEDRARLLRVLAYMGLARAFAVVEVLVLLWGLMPDRDRVWLLQLAVLVQAATQVLQYAALVVPGQIGAIEAGTAGVFAMLGLGGWLGLALELLRRGRKLLAIALAIPLWAVMAKRGT